MKIALFIPSLHVGGIRRVVVNLARGFSEAGLDTDLVILNLDAEREFVSQISPGVNIVNLDASRALTSLFPLIRYLRRERPDVLLASSAPINLVAIWARMLARVSTRIAVCSMNTLSSFDANVLHKREKAYPFLARLFYPRADHIIAIAEGIVRLAHGDHAFGPVKQGARVLLLRFNVHGLITVDWIHDWRQE